MVHCIKKIIKLLTTVLYFYIILLGVFMEIDDFDLLLRHGMVVFLLIGLLLISILIGYVMYVVKRKNK